MTAPLEVGDLITVRDHLGALHLAFAWCNYPTYQADAPDGPWPVEDFHIAYFSDHPGESVRCADARSAREDLRRLTWYIAPFRDELASWGPYNSRSRDAVREVLGRVPVSDFLTCQAGETCPRPGRWIMRGTDHAVEVRVGEPLPHHAFFPNHPPLWTRWDLPLG
jgi:hypothetical protein